MLRDPSRERLEHAVESREEREIHRASFRHNGFRDLAHDNFMPIARYVLVRTKLLASASRAPASGPLDRGASHSPFIAIFGLPDELAHAAILYDEGHALHAVIELESMLREGLQAMVAAATP